MSEFPGYFAVELVLNAVVGKIPIDCDRVPMDSDMVPNACEVVPIIGETVHNVGEKVAFGCGDDVALDPIRLGVKELGEVPIVLGVIVLGVVPIVLGVIELEEPPKHAPNVPGTAPSGAGRPGLDRHS